MTFSATSPLGALIISAGFLALSACATATKTDTTQASDSASDPVVVTAETLKEAEKVAETGDPDEKVCRRVKQTTTRFTKKVCYSRKQWRQMAEQARRGTAETQQRAFDPGRGN